MGTEPPAGKVLGIAAIKHVRNQNHTVGALRIHPAWLGDHEMVYRRG
jgi:hypothetical protein